MSFSKSNFLLNIENNGESSSGANNENKNAWNNDPWEKSGFGKKSRPDTKAIINENNAKPPEYLLRYKPKNTGKTAETQIKSATRKRYKTLMPFEEIKIVIIATIKVIYFDNDNNFLLFDKFDLFFTRIPS